MLARLRAASLLGSSVVLVLVLGGLATWGMASTAHRVDTAQRADRLRLEQTLSGLTQQYLRFAFFDTNRAAQSVAWQMKPSDATDRAALARIVAQSPLTTYGAVLTSPTGLPLTWYAPHGLPSPFDPGFSPLKSALLSGKPGLSDVIKVGKHDIVAFAVPVMRSGVVQGLLLAFADVRTWPLQGYNSTIQVGAGATPYVVDSRGVVATSRDASLIGTQLVDLPGRVLAGGSGVFTAKVNHKSLVVSYAPAGSGWTTLTTQPVRTFSGVFTSGAQHDAEIVAVLITVAIGLLVSFNHLRQRALKRLAEERMHDPLTGLAQRRLFSLRLEAALARQRRSRQSVAALYLDLDGFKGINDSFGHNVGDQLLVAVADRLSAAVREDDMVARLGGDEFAIIAESMSPAEVTELVGRLTRVVSEPLTIGRVTLQPRISIGAAVLRDPARAEDLLVEADLAMYRRKHGEQQAVVVLDELPEQRSEPGGPRIPTQVPR